MSVIVTDTGFAPDDFTGEFAPLDTPTDTAAVDLGSDTDPDRLASVALDAPLVRIDFPGFADGRGFTLARRLRELGFAGRLRAKGHVLADQYAMARRAGFDEVEIDAALARRQPEDQWRARANWTEHHYQDRLRRRTAG